MKTPHISLATLFAASSVSLLAVLSIQKLPDVTLQAQVNAEAAVPRCTGSTDCAYGQECFFERDPETNIQFGTCKARTATCLSTDAGEGTTNHFVKGITTLKMGNKVLEEHVDECIVNEYDEQVDVEYYCKGKSEVAKELRVCENGCSDGRCLLNKYYKEPSSAPSVTHFPTKLGDPLVLDPATHTYTQNGKPGVVDRATGVFRLIEEGSPEYAWWSCQQSKKYVKDQPFSPRDCSSLDGAWNGVKPAAATQPAAARGGERSSDSRTTRQTPERQQRIETLRRANRARRVNSRSMRNGASSSSASGTTN